MGGKAQLHFILCGVFSLVGIVLLVMAILGKSGAAKSLDDAKAKLDGASKSPLATQGDLDAAKGRQTAFKTEVGDFEDKLRSDIGDRLRIFKKDYTDTQQFYANEFDGKSKEFKARLKAIRKDPVPPARLQKGADEDSPNAKKFSNLPDTEKFWVALDRTMITWPANNLVTAQSQLKVMNEVIAVLEKLRAADQFKDTTFIFDSFDMLGFTGEAAKEPTQPWSRREFAVVMWCDPTFALAFAEEMCNPSDKTKGDVNAGGRAFLPMELVQFSAEMVGRPHDAQYLIGNAEREAWGISPTLAPDEFIDSTKQRDAADKLAAEERLVMPLRYVIRLHALQLNKEWAAMAVK